MPPAPETTPSASPKTKAAAERTGGAGGRSRGEAKGRIEADPELAHGGWTLYPAMLFLGVLVGLAAAAFHGALDGMERLRAGLHAPAEWLPPWAATLLDPARPLPGAEGGSVGPLPISALGVWTTSAFDGMEALRGVLAGAMTAPPVLAAGALFGAVTTVLAVWAVRSLAPDATGSGIPQVVAAFEPEERIRWRRILPVKFGAGVLGIGSGMVLGREGPTIHVGAALGEMLRSLRLIGADDRRIALAAGAGAGLAAAFNAPLAGIVFVTEEMRRHFDFSFRALQSVLLAAVAATLVSDQIFGFGPILAIPGFDRPSTETLLLCLPLGVVLGAAAVVFNAGLAHRDRLFLGMPGRHPLFWAAAVGALAGALAAGAPPLTGGGDGVIMSDFTAPPGFWTLVTLSLARTAMLFASYSTGVPGGIFAPMLSIGTAIGVAYGLALAAWGIDLDPGLFGVAAMGALFAATVRAPLTGIVIVVEMTGSTDLIFAIVITALAATFVAELLGGKPIYKLLAVGT